MTGPVQRVAGRAGELTLVVCGAPLAARAGEAAERLEQRWSVSVVVTDAAGQWFDRPVRT